MTFDRAVVPCLVVGLLASCTSVAQKGPDDELDPDGKGDGIPTGASQPNILLIIADDVAVANIGAYQVDVPGSAPPPTPNIDALAARGVRFRQVWSNPVCSPTRASLYTGRYSFRTGIGYVVQEGDGLATDETTIAEVLTNAGYASALIGKWHLGTTVEIGGNDAPRTAGWQYHAGVLGGYIGDELDSYTNWERFVNGQSTGFTTVYGATQNVDDALAWIGTQTGPWMTTVAFNSAHAPFHRPPAGLYTSDLTGIIDCYASSASKRRCYKAAVEAMDTEIGRLLASIDLSTTMVAFVGDNGTPPDVVDPGFSPRAKATVYQGGVVVPLIIAGPQVVDGGRVVDDLVNTSDVFATVARMAGATQTTGVDSIRLTPYLTNGTSTPRSYAYTEHFIGTAPDTAGGTAAIRDARYKAIEVRGEMTECYDLAADPGETGNLVGASTPAACGALYDTMESLR